MAACHGRCVRRRARRPLKAPPQSPQRPPLAVPLLLFLLGARRAGGQFAKNTELYKQAMGAADGLLQAQVQDSEELWNIFYPNQYLLPTDYYNWMPPNRETQYTQNVVFDPCRSYDYKCCFDTYGTPEFLDVDTDPASPTYGTRTSVLDSGATIDPTTSRRPDDEYYIDNSCTGVNQPPGRTDCVMSRLARRPFSIQPVCWNNNDTLVVRRGRGEMRAPPRGAQPDPPHLPRPSPAPAPAPAHLPNVSPHPRHPRFPRRQTATAARRRTARRCRCASSWP